jgi:hypothetical protein
VFKDTTSVVVYIPVEPEPEFPNQGAFNIVVGRPKNNSGRITVEWPRDSSGEYRQEPQPWVNDPKWVLTYQLNNSVRGPLLWTDIFDPAINPKWAAECAAVFAPEPDPDPVSPVTYEIRCENLDQPSTQPISLWVELSRPAPEPGWIVTSGAQTNTWEEMVGEGDITQAAWPRIGNSSTTRSWTASRSWSVTRRRP